MAFDIGAFLKEEAKKKKKQHEEHRKQNAEISGQYKTITNSKGEIEHVGINSNATSYDPLKIGDSVKWVPQGIKASIPQGVSFDNESSYNNYVNNLKGVSYYGNNLSYNQVKSYISDLKSNSMAAVKDPDYSAKLKFLDDYSINYGYKDKKYANEYISEINKQIESLKKEGELIKSPVVDKNIQLTDYQKQILESKVPNKNQTKIDELQKQLDEFQAKVVAQSKIDEERKKIEKLKENDDYKEKTKNIDYNKFFQGFDKVGYDRGIIGSAQDENKEAWYNYVAENDRLTVNAALYDININALDEDQKNALVYLFKKIGDKNIDEAIKNGEVVTDGSQEARAAAEQELKSTATNELLNFINSIKNDEEFKSKNEVAEQKAIADSSLFNKAITTAESVAIKPAADLAVTIGSGIQSISGKIDTESDFYKVSNYIRKNRGAISQSINDEYGGTASFIYDLGINAADMLVQHSLGAALSNGIKYSNYASEANVAKNVFKNASRAIMANSAYADTVLSAKDKGLSDSQSVALGAVAAFAEVITEQYGLENLFEIFNKNVSKSTVKSVVKELSKQMLFEGSEEVASDIINTGADLLISKDKSDFLNTYNEYKESGLTSGKAAAMTLKDTAIDYGKDFLSGALMGLVMGSVGTVKNTKQYNSFVKNENLGVSKIILLSDEKTEEFLDLAKKQGIKTDKFENEYKKLEETAQEVDETDESIEIYSSQFDKAAQEFDKIRSKVENKNHDVANNTKDFVKQFLKGNNQSAIETVNNDGVEINDGIDGNGAFVDNTESNIDVTGEADNRKSVADTLKRNNRLASINETAKSETALQDLTEHIDDQYYRIVYNETVNVEDGNPSTAHAVPLPLTREALVGEDGNASADKEGDHTGYAPTNSTSVGESTNSAKGFSATERSAEFNRIYDMGMDEDIPPHEIESDIFTPEQVRRIYAAAVIDDNKRNNYSEQVNFTELLKEYEDKAAIAQFGNETVKNIMTASAEQVRSSAKKLGINVEFVNKVPGKNPNADGAYNPKTNTIYINNNTKYPMQQVFLHELTHFFESADNYSEFQNTVFKSRAFKKWLGKYTNLKNDKYKSIDEYRNALKERYGEKDDTKINREMVAFFVSDNLFQKDFGDLGRLATELNGSKKERFISFIKNIFKRFKNAVSGIDKLEKKFLSLYRTAGQNENTDNNNGVKQMSIEKTIDNKPVVIVENNILDGVPKKDWIKTVKQTISDKFSSGIPISGRLIKVNAITKNEFTKSKYSQFLRATDGTIYADKFKSANNLDEILLATTNYVNEDLKHIRKDKIKEFARGDVLIRVGNNDYSAKVIVGFTGTNMLLYDIVEFTPTNFTIKKRIHQEFGESRTPRNDVSSNTNISQKDNGVNSSISEKSKNDTDIPQMNTGEDTENVFGFEVNKNADVNEDLLEELSIYDKNAEVDRNGNVTVYHRTTAENAQQILNTGIMKAKEDALFFSSQPKEYASDYGDTVVKLKIPSNKLLVNDIFDGEVHFEIPLQYRNGSFKLNVSQYIDKDNSYIPQMNTGEDIDSEYMSAVENGDTDTAQRFVDEAAKQAGYTIKAYHGTLTKGITEFKKEFIGSRFSYDDVGFFFTDNLSIAKDYATSEFDSDRKGEVISAYIKTSNAFVFDKNYAMKNGYGNVFRDNDCINVWDIYQSALLEEAENHNADSIIVKDGQSMMVVAFNPNQIKSAEPIVYDDNGDVIPLYERFNEDNNDIRYMLSEEDKFDSFGNYFDKDENGEVTFISADQYQDELKKNPKIGVLDKQQIELKAKSLLKTYQSRMDSANVASQLLAIYNDIKNIDKNGNHARPKVEKLANDIYDNIVEKVSNGEVYEQLKNVLQGSKMLWTDEVKTAFGSDWNDFIRKNRHRLNLIKADSGKVGIGIDVMYDNLCRELPGFFDGNAKGPKAQLNEMLDVLNGQQFVYDTFLDDNKEDIINQIISDIYGGFAQIDYIKKGSDKAKSQTDYKFDNQYLDEYGIDDKRFKADMRKQINEKSADFVKEQKKKYKDGEISAEQFADSLTDHFARVSLTAKIKPLESYYRQSDKYRQRFKQINERTTKNLKELRSMLQNPTEGKYIPADLVDLVQDVLNIGDNQNFKLRDKLKRYRDTLSRADIDEGILDVYKQAIDKCEDELSKQNLGQVFAEIHRKYNSYKTGKAENTQAGEFEQSFYCYHEAVAQKLEQVAATLENADMTRLTMRQAEALDEGLNCLTHFVKNSVKAIGLTESAHIAEVGHDMIQETKSTAVHKNFASKMLNTAINAELSPERMFRRMGGYKADSMWVKMADMLTEGQTQAEVIKQRLKDVIAPALNGENMKNAENARSYKNKDLVDIGLVDENGESVKVPHSFMISAYLHLQNEANQNHALKGGFEIPDFRTYYKGKISKSFTEGKIKARFTDVTSALKKLEQNMSEYDKVVAKNVALLFDTHTKSEYNKINTDVFGFEKAKVKHYFPIYSSNDFIATGFDISYEASLKNQGNMKSRVAGAVNPIKLMDVFDVVDKEISRCGEYCGKLKAEITMTRVYNTTTAEFGTSLKEQVGLHFGESGKKYIEHLMQDYSGTRKTENSVALSKLRGAVATSALMGNINVAMKQAGSYPTAAATIGWKPLLKALAVSDEGAKVFYRANRQLIDKYTPWLRYRTEGYSTQEIADLKNLSFYNKRQMKWLFGWINASDIATVGRLWQAAQYYVDDNNVEIKKGTDEYYKQVAKVFNKIIFDTQPNYTVMQRPDILRNPNSLLKSMIMFSTQPLQNLGILYDSAMNYNAQLKAFKQGKVEKSVLQEAKRGLARGISSIVVSAGVISLMTLLAKAIRGKLDDYLDKYGEFNAVGILKGSLKVFGSTLAGMVTFGSEIYNFIMSAVTGDTYYGVNISSIDLISDVFESFINEITAVKNQKDILNKTVAFVEKASALFGFPARNIKNLFGGVTNLISTGDWFALNEKKTDSQYYAQMYDCCINGENEKYNKLYNELLERGKTVNEIEGGIKTCLKEAESDDIKEAAQALIDGDNKIYNDIINEFISRGFDEKIVLETVDEAYDKLKGDELTDEQKKTKEKSKYTYMQNLLNKIDFSGLSSKQKAEAQQEVEKMADEYGYQAATGEPKNATYDNALKSDKAGVVPAKDFVIAKTLLQKKYADADGDGNVSAQEKYDAIQKSNIPSEIKKLLQAMNIMGSKKIDTDNDGKRDTAFDDLQPSEQKAYIDENNSDILKMLEDTNASAEKSKVKANHRENLESRIDVFSYKDKLREDVQNEIDYLSSAAADIEVSGDTDKSTAKAFLHFDESGFIDIADYVKFYVNAKKYTKNEEKLEVINQLDISDNAKLRLKLWTVASGWSLDSDGDGKRDKRISTYSPEFQEKWIKENAGYIQSNCSYWR